MKFSGNSKQRRVARRVYEREARLWSRIFTAYWESKQRMWDDKEYRL
jgi:hypothetical protein